MTGLASEYDYVDRHPADANCDMPGTGWLLADPSCCVIASTADPAGRAINALEPADPAPPVQCPAPEEQP
jgi:hypothetical protein